MEIKLNSQQTKDKALRFLEYRSHTERELSQKLIRAGADMDDINKTMEFLKEYGFIDDRKYAISKAKDLSLLKKYGKKRIESDLKNRGIDAEYIEEAVLGLEVDELEILMPLVLKKLRGDFEKKNIDKTIRYFFSRGYKIEDIKTCIEELKNSTYSE